jgi:hypothetical protein
MADHKRTDPDLVRAFDAELADERGRPVPEDEARRALEGTPASGPLVMLRSNRLLIIATLAGAIVVGAIIALATDSWWLLPVVVVVHLTATAAFVATTFRLVGETEKPDPVTVARLEDRGVSDPEARVNEAVEHMRNSDP